MVCYAAHTIYTAHLRGEALAYMTRQGQEGEFFGLKEKRPDLYGELDIARAREVVEARMETSDIEGGNPDR